jgi:hypothetical protein
MKKTAVEKGSTQAGVAPVPVAQQPIAPAKKTKLPETTEAYPWHSSHDVKKESNPFTESDWRMWIYAWAGLLVRFVIIFGAIFTVVQFLAARDSTRVERSLAMVEMWEEPEYLEARNALDERLIALLTAKKDLLGNQPTPEERRFFMERIGLDAMTETGGTMPLKQFQEHFDRIVYFLNRLGFCIEGSLCSAPVADAFFRDFAISFWEYFSGYVAKVRRSKPTYAEAIEQYVVRAQAPPAQTP